jgi:hypothetical protein
MAKSLSIFQTFRSLLTDSSHVKFGLPRPLLTFSARFIRPLCTGASGGLRWICPNHLRRCWTSFSSIGATPTLSRISSFRTRSFLVWPHIHLNMRITATTWTETNKFIYSMKVAKVTAPTHTRLQKPGIWRRKTTTQGCHGKSLCYVLLLAKARSPGTSGNPYRYCRKATIHCRRHTTHTTTHTHAHYRRGLHTATYWNRNKHKLEQTQTERSRTPRHQRTWAKHPRQEHTLRDHKRLDIKELATKLKPEVLMMSTTRTRSTGK